MSTRRNDQEQPVDAPRADEPSVDAMALLKEDHQRVRDLLAHYEAASNAEAKWTFAKEVFVKLETHAQLEENIFYPSVNEETEEGPELGKESLQEHAIVKQRIAELRQMGPHTKEFDAKFHERRHNVAHHVEAEEAAIFPLAEEALPEDLDEMRAEGVPPSPLDHCRGRAGQQHLTLPAVPKTSAATGSGHDAGAVREVLHVNRCAACVAIPCKSMLSRPLPEAYGTPPITRPCRSAQPSLSVRWG